MAFSKLRIYRQLFECQLQVPLDKLHIRHQRPAVREGSLGAGSLPADARRIRPDRDATQRRGCPAGARARSAARPVAAAGHNLLQIARRRIECRRGRG